MDFFKEQGLKPFINAHDTYTIYGGSRMAENTLEAMREVSPAFCGYGTAAKKPGVFSCPDDRQ